MTSPLKPTAIATASLAAIFANILTPSTTHAAIVSKEVLKSFFIKGAKPTSEQFGTLLDSLVNYTDDRYLIGLRQYDPTLIYQSGDPAVAIKRFGIGDTTPEAPTGIGYANPDTTPIDLDTDFSGQFGFMALQFGDTTGQTYYGFMQVYMPPLPTDGSDPTIRVQYIEFDDTPNTPVTTFAVPEIPPRAGSLILGERCDLHHLQLQAANNAFGRSRIC